MKGNGTLVEIVFICSFFFKEKRMKTSILHTLSQAKSKKDRQKREIFPGTKEE